MSAQHLPTGEEAPFRDRHAGLTAGPEGYCEEGVFSVVIDDHCYQVPRYCPHRAGRLDHGHINEQRKTVTCPLHHSVFSLETGKQLSGPACGQLTVQVQPPRQSTPHFTQPAEASAKDTE